MQFKELRYFQHLLEIVIIIYFQCNPSIDKTFESVVQRLSLSCQGADALRCRLDAVSTSFERDERRLSAIYLPTFDEMKDLTRQIVDEVTSAVHILSVIEISDADARYNAGRRTSSSMSDLPDPSGLDLNQVDAESVRQRVEVLEQQIEEKDKLIEGQHEVLQEYRAEIFRLRDHKNCPKTGLLRCPSYFDRMIQAMKLGILFTMVLRH